MNANPEITKELKRIADASGGILYPASIVEAARPVRSILHSKFEWDDTVAAQQYRIWQARALINVTVELIQTNDPKSLSRIFVSLKDDRNRGGYRPLVQVLSDEEMRKKLLADALYEMTAFERRYQRLRELSQVFEVMKIARRKMRPKLVRV